MSHQVGAKIPRWTKTEDEILRDFAGVVKYAVIADALERRTTNQVRARMQYLGIKTRPVGRTEETNQRRREYTNRWKYNNRSKVASYQGVRNFKLDGDYNRRDIFARDGWICQLCNEEVPQRELPKNDPQEPTIDHILSLANGGTDTFDNVQLAHRICNTRKGKK